MQQLNRTIQRRSLLLNSVKDAVIATDIKGTIIDWNSGAEALYGHTAQEAIGQNISVLAHTQMSDEQWAESREALHAQGAWRGEVIQYDRADCPLEIESRVSRLLDRDGAIVGLIAVNRDIRERKLAEAALGKALAHEQIARTQAEITRERMALLLEVSTHLSESLDYHAQFEKFVQIVVPRLADWCTIYMREKDGTLKRIVTRHANPTKVVWAAELHRLHPPAPGRVSEIYAVMQDGQARIYPDVSDSLLIAAFPDPEQLRIARELQLTSAMFVPFIAHGQILGAITLVTGESGRHFDAADLQLMTDLARRAAVLLENAQLYAEAQRFNSELETRVAERTAQLEAANQELEAFSYSVSHDLRSPLRAVDGFSRILMRDYAAQLPPDAQRQLRLVRENAQQMGCLIDDLLIFARLSRQPLNKHPIAPADQVQQVLEALADEREKRQVEITFGELPLYEADPALIRQVWLNLLSNALKYTRKRSVAHIEIGCRLIGHERAYFVKDNGTGFDMRYVNKLFGVFQRLHRAEDYEGTGVGLAIVQRVIHRHGGRVWAEGEVDKGATFYFTVSQGNPDGD